MVLRTAIDMWRVQQLSWKHSLQYEEQYEYKHFPDAYSLLTAKTLQERELDMNISIILHSPNQAATPDFHLVFQTKTSNCRVLQFPS